MSTFHSKYRFFYHSNRNGSPGRKCRFFYHSNRNGSPGRKYRFFYHSNRNGSPGRKCRFFTIPMGMVRSVEYAGFPFHACRKVCIHLPDAYLTACDFYNPISILPSDNPIRDFLYRSAYFLSEKKKHNKIGDLIL